jgi:hypothetical protein
VVHYAGLCRSWHVGPIEEVSLSEFALGHPVRIVDHWGPTYSPLEIVQRARSRLGEDSFDLLTNNCEHFCNWCISGLHRSAQVERHLATRPMALSMVANLAAWTPWLIGWRRQRA